MILRNIDQFQTAVKGQVTILSENAPASLTITGADVDGLPDDYTLAAGSKLITATKDYIAFTDGEFTEKT